MKLKPGPERRAAARQHQCIVDGCARHWFSFGFCSPHLLELDKGLRSMFEVPELELEDELTEGEKRNLQAKGEWK